MEPARLSNRGERRLRNLFRKAIKKERGVRPPKSAWDAWTVPPQAHGLHQDIADIITDFAGLVWRKDIYGKKGFEVGAACLHPDCRNRIYTLDYPMPELPVSTPRMEVATPMESYRYFCSADCLSRQREIRESEDMKYSNRDYHNPRIWSDTRFGDLSIVDPYTGERIGARSKRW